MQFVMGVDDSTETTPPWQSANNNTDINSIHHTEETTPPWQIEGSTGLVRTNDQDDWNIDVSDTAPSPLQMDDWGNYHTRSRTHGNRTPADMDTASLIREHDGTYIHDDQTRRHSAIHPTNYSHSDSTDSYTSNIPEEVVRLHKGRKSVKPKKDSETLTDIIGLDGQGKSYRKSKKVSFTDRDSEVKRSWPEPREKGERRMIAANYAAVEIHGFFGLIDDGSVGEGRMLIVHVPKWIRGYFLDIRQGDTLHVYHANGGKIGGTLTVLSTGRHQYYAPGRRVTTCTVCVPEEQWAPFS
jgi:hypothetical protein